MGRRKFLGAAFVAIWPMLVVSTGCGTEPQVNEGEVGQSAKAAVTCNSGYFSYYYNGDRFDYMLNVPAAPNGKLLVGLHGGGGTNIAYVSQWKLGELSDEMGFIALAPNGHPALTGGYVWNSGHCCASAVENNKDSVGMLTALIKDVKAACGASSVYMTGHSNGGMMAIRMQESSTLGISGIAPFSSTVGLNRPSGISWTMSAVTAPRVVYVHGKLDTNVRYNGGVTSATGVEEGRYDTSFADARSLFQSKTSTRLKSYTNSGAYTTLYYANSNKSKELYFRTVNAWEHDASSLDAAYPTGTKGALKDALVLLGM